jgi:hypothetical protein
MTRTFKIVRDLVNAMDWALPICSRNGSTLFLCNTLFLRVGSVVLDSDDNEYLVTSVVNNTSIVVSGEQPFVGEFVYVLERPTFLQGKWISANNEYLLMDNDTSNKTPLIWLVRGYEETFNSESNSVKMEVEPLIYFLDQADFNEWTNDDHDQQAVNPMYNLALHFVETVKKSGQFVDVEGWKIKDEPRFGVEITKEKGNSKRILSDDLSGVGLRIPLKFLGNCDTNCNC